MTKGAKILLVDDEEPVLNLLRETLQGCGYSIDTASCSQEALVKVKDETYNMIILDVLLPDQNGYLLAQEIKRLCPGLGNRILFISGILFGKSTMDHLSSIGAGFLSKPFQLDSLIKAVDRITNLQTAS